MVRNSGEIDGKRFDVAILGGGLGGLQCGYILAKNGLNVCVIEKNPLAGGCLQSFRRRGAGDTICEFDTGLHYVGGLDEQAFFIFRTIGSALAKDGSGGFR